MVLAEYCYEGDPLSNIFSVCFGVKKGCVGPAVGKHGEKSNLVEGARNWKRGMKK